MPVKAARPERGCKRRAGKLTFEPVILLAFTGEGFGHRGYSSFSGIQYFPLDPVFRADLILLSRGDQVIFPFTGHQDFSVDFPDRVSAPDFRQGIQGEFGQEQSAAAVIVQTFLPVPLNRPSALLRVSSSDDTCSFFCSGG